MSDDGAAGGRHPWATFAFPAKDRERYPVRWLLVVRWRRFVFFSPRIRDASWQVTVDIAPWRQGVLVGLWTGRDDDDEINVRLGMGLVEIDATRLTWLPHSDGYPATD